MMTESPEAVLLYIPLMKHVGMSWKEIKDTPSLELKLILNAYYEHEKLHSMDGYSDKEVSEMAKHKPEVRSRYAEYLLTQRKYQDMLGAKSKKPTFRGIM